MIDETHDPAALCWVPEADAHDDFPVQNLPFGIFSTPGTMPRAGVAIGEFVLDLAAVAPMLDPAAKVAVAAATSSDVLNALFVLPTHARRALRHALFRLLINPAQAQHATAALFPMAQCRLHMPLAIRDFTDFYAGIHHARAVGSLLRPDNPLLPNYKYIPVGYHGRASSVRVSGGTIVRPNGQLRPPDTDAPVLAPSRRLDYEVELGLWIGGKSELGQPIPISEAANRIAGVCLLNDWSARDIQAWEYQPLGPFLAKNFATTISPWVVTAEALAPYRVAQPARPEGDPIPLPYLLDEQDQMGGAFDICIEVSLCTQRMREDGTEPATLGRTSTTSLYWTPAQLVAHHSVNGCDLAAGDLMGTGTISGPDDHARGSLMELSRGGRQPVVLPNGETRIFLEDGDEVRLVGWAKRDGFRRIGIGIAVATIAGKA